MRCSRLRHRAYALFVFLAAAFFVVSTVPVHAIGLAPATLMVNRLPKDYQYAGEVYISRGNPSEDTRVEIFLSGIAAEYISLPKGNRMTLPKGEKQVAVPVVISTKGLASGTYKAEIKIIEKPPEEKIEGEGSVSMLATGVLGEIVFDVVDQEVEDYTVGGLKMTGTEDQEVIGFSFQLSNKGNVSARPTKIDFVVINDVDQTTVYSETISADIVKPVNAFSDTWVSVKTKARLGIGRYMAKADFYKNDAKIATYTHPFQVFPKGTLDQKGELLSASSDKEIYDQGETVKFSGLFKNEGTIGLAPQFVVEIFQKSKRIETLVSESGFLPQGREAEVTHFFEPKQGGSYRATAYVNYGPFKSKEFEIKFTVKDSLAIVLIAIGGITFALALLAFVVYNKKRRKAFRQTSDQIIPTKQS